MYCRNNFFFMLNQVELMTVYNENELKIKFFVRFGINCNIQGVVAMNVEWRVVHSSLIQYEQYEPHTNEQKMLELLKIL